ncbi:hypothetical protein OUZ56_018378 [Daphnia magna]|uniref:Uncharacterized protein n=1 Tax=Daphnia magna TaxID=35525 RepID=A0ABQ9Z8N4_9CRUS|nr:hypothetical protein OUZ56_018378 [Daphnia magna]
MTYLHISMYANTSGMLIDIILPLCLRQMTMETGCSIVLNFLREETTFCLPSVHFDSKVAFN